MSDRSCHYAIALQLRKLASDPDSQCFLARDDACVGGIITLLNTDVDRETLLLTLQAVNFLCEPPSNRLHLSAVNGLLLRLITLAESDDAEVSRTSGAAVTTLSAAITESASAAASAVSRRESRTSRSSTGGGAAPSRSRYLYSLCYQIHNGTNSADERDAVERALIGIRGVISVSVSAVGVITVYCQKRDDGTSTDMTARVLTAVRTVDDQLTIRINGQRERGAREQTAARSQHTAALAPPLKANTTVLRVAGQSCARGECGLRVEYFAGAVQREEEEGGRDRKQADGDEGPSRASLLLLLVSKCQGETQTGLTWCMIQSERRAVISSS